MPEGTACKNKREKTNRLKCRMKRFVRFLKHVRFVFFCQGYPFKCWSAVGQYIMSKACFPGECFSQWTVSSSQTWKSSTGLKPDWQQDLKNEVSKSLPSRCETSLRAHETARVRKNSNVGIYLGFPSLMLNPGLFLAKISWLSRQLTKPREKLAPSMEQNKKFWETLTGVRLMIKKPSQELMKGWTAKMSKPEPCVEVRFHLLSTGARYFLTQPGSNPKLGNNGQVRLWSECEPF